MKKIVCSLFIFLNTLVVFAAEKQEWIFVTEMSGKKNQEQQYWRIENGRFEIKLNEEIPVLYTETFNDLIQEAKKNNIPFFLVLLTTKTTMNVYEGKEAFKFLTEKWYSSKWLHEQLPIQHPRYPWHPENYPPAFFADPLTNEKVTNISIFVMGEDGQFILLKDNAKVKYLNNFGDIQQVDKEVIGGTPTMKYDYDIKALLSQKGHAQVFVGDLFNQEAETKVGIEKEILLQHARHWYDLAMKYLPKMSTLYAQVKHKRNQIPYKPELLKRPELVKKTEPEQLMKSLQNLNKTLGQLRQKLG